MDHLISKLLTIVAVVAIVLVVIFQGISPVIEKKGNDVEQQINGASLTTIGQ